MLFINMLKFIFLCCIIFAVEGKWVTEMEIGGNFQGDIMLDPDEQPQNKNAFASIKGGRWPGGSIPYLISRSFTYTEKRKIMEAIDEYHKKTCIKWVPRMAERESVTFVKAFGCHSEIGYRKGRKNAISLGYGCVDPGIIIHEMGHTVGFYHEQARPDRDDFLTIQWENITEDHKHNFDKLNNTIIDSLGFPYDYLSIMHYGGKTFGGGKVTMKTKDPTMQYVIGGGTALSKTDVKQINKMYNCPE